MSSSVTARDKTMYLHVSLLITVYNWMVKTAIEWVTIALRWSLLQLDSCPLKTSQCNQMVISALGQLRLQSDGPLLQLDGSESLIPVLYYFSQMC